MQGLDILYWGLSMLFCLAMGFAILLWCRSWRKEEREESAKQIGALATEVARLVEAVDMLEHTSSSLRTADEQIARNIEDLRNCVVRLRQSVPVESRADIPVSGTPEPETSVLPDTIASGDAGATDQELELDPFAEARSRLKSGQTPVEVAKALDIGTAEVRMIARMMGLK
jgi:predicted RNase H-like nuclease (RuvC/YqgF family)